LMLPFSIVFLQQLIVNLEHLTKQGGEVIVRLADSMNLRRDAVATHRHSKRPRKTLNILKPTVRLLMFEMSPFYEHWKDEQGRVGVEVLRHRLGDDDQTEVSEDSFAGFLQRLRSNLSGFMQQWVAS